MEQKQEEYLRLLKEVISDYFYISYIKKQHIEASKSTYISYVYATIKKPIINKNIMNKYADIFYAIISIFELYEIQKQEVLTTNTYIANILLRNLYIDYLKNKTKTYKNQVKNDTLETINEGIKKQYAKFFSLQDILVFCLKALDLEPISKSAELDNAIQDIKAKFGDDAVFNDNDLKIDIVEYIKKDFDLETNGNFLSLTQIVSELKETSLYLSDYEFILGMQGKHFKKFRDKMLNYDTFTDKLLYNSDKSYSIEETIRKNIQLPMQYNRVNIKTYFERNKFYKVDDEFLLFLNASRQRLYIDIFNEYNKREQNESEGKNE